MLGRAMEGFVREKAARPMADHFGGRMNPDALAFAMLQVGAVLVIMRASAMGLIVLGSEMTDLDVLGMLMVVLFMFGYVLRSFGLADARRSGWTSRASEVPQDTRAGWIWVTLSALVFNLLAFFPGDILFTLDVVAFACIALASQLQGMDVPEKVQDVPGTS